MINSKIDKLARAITIAEGWLPESPSLSFRNHNPGALKSSPFSLGGRNGFVYFLNDNVGFFALMWDLAQKCVGKTRTNLGPTSTIEDLVRTYTAEQDLEKLENYIKIVERITGKNRSTQLEYFVK